MTHGLRLGELRAANKARQVELAEMGRGSSFTWSDDHHLTRIDDELAELAGAYAEYANGGSRKALCDEFADVLICLDLFAMSLGVDLSEAVTSKFNERSVEWAVPVALGEHDKAGEIE